MKQKIVLFLMFLFSLSAYSQYVDEVRGTIIDAGTKNPLQGVSVSLSSQKLYSITDEKGEFILKNVRLGDDQLVVTSASVTEVQFPVSIQARAQYLGTFEVESNQIDVSSINDAFVATLDESVLDFDDDDGSSSQGINSLIIVSDDPYLSVTNYPFQGPRVRYRGYDQRYAKTYLNGIEFNEQIRGSFNYSMLGAMNDVTKEGDALNFMQPGSFTFGAIGGSQDINLRASAQRKGGKITASALNGTYYLRGMASYSTGLMDNGWAVTGLVGTRYADEGYIEGSFYHNVSYFLSVEKQWDQGRQSLSFTTFGSPVQRAGGTAVVNEAYLLTGDHYYNPDWGYQDGDKRNARVVTSYQPTAILSHIWKINNLTKLTTGASFSYSRYGKTAINWYENASDPRPDYYRKLPSYWTEQKDIDKYTGIWTSENKKYTQLNWDEMYEANRLAKHEKPDAPSLYMVEERRSDVLDFSFNSTLDTRLSDHIQMNAGAGFRYSKGMYYKTASDLMDGNYVLDIDKYGERDFQPNNVLQNDLNNPNRRIYKDDKFGYDYDLHVISSNIWLQNQHEYNHFDLYYGFKLTYTEFQREGNMRNGRNPMDSYGKGKIHNFTDPMIKAGLTYKLDGRNFFVGNVSYGTQAPRSYDAYISPRVKDAEVPYLQSERIFSVDVSYIFSYPRVRGRISAFQTNFYDQTKSTSYFHDVYGTYLHHIMSNVNTIHRGFELGVTWEPVQNLSFSFGGTLSDNHYTNRPDGTMSYENNLAPDIHEKVYIKDFYVGGSPQYAGTFGIHYFYDYWFFDANLNGFAHSYLDPTPIRRTKSTFDTFWADSNKDYWANYDDLIKQTKLKGGLTLDLSVGKMLFLRNGQSLNFNLNVKNVLNNENIQQWGYEQGRIDKQNFEVGKFPAKITYMQGISCFFNVGYRF
ncbi:MAG: carboxypeptidase-like regulatory domain-containing protein [Dysgonomonas sp.]